MSAFWHPFADMTSVQDNPFIVDRAEGVYVYDEAGRRFLDAAASLWYTNIGHGRSEVIEAVNRQMEKLPVFHTYIDYATRPALDLAERIAAVSPDPGSKVFFGSGGSDAIDTAAKLARRYFHAIGQPERTVFIARSWAYHGMHAYGTSLGGMEPNRDGFGDLVAEIRFVPYDDPDAVKAVVDEVGAERVAGMFAEAVIGSGGVRPVPTEYLKQARETIREAGAVYISDEVITGFGRLGDWFAANRFELEPDMMTFAKGVTCGYAPLGGVVASPRIAEPFFETPGLIFRHGYTYSGHTASCAAGLAVMDIIESDGILDQARRLETVLFEAFQSLLDLDVVTEIRGGVGALVAVQLDESDPTLASRAAGAVRQHGSVLTRAIGGGGLQVSPPLTMTDDEVDAMVEGFRKGLESL
ncbi:MAG: aminotransferase class III-fold pyridoxal phosphate-dependent enzyme [Acidimicrobiia bacterium]|nr:aminotransferase class III-fold pyridoxal phosphate-dependent enzyme [Acidimicrobiia bacterium]